MKLLTFALLIAFVSSPSAGVLKEISTSSTYDDNVFGSAAGTSDYITEISVYVANRFTDPRSATRIYYSGSGYLFVRSTDRLFSVHGLGLTYARRIGGQKNMLYAGASFRLRVNRDIYEIYDYNGFNAYLSGKWYALKNFILVSRYSLNTRSYWNLGDESYTDHNFSFRATKSLASGTTLRGDAAYGHKTHFGSESQVLLGGQMAQSLMPGVGLSVRYQRRLNVQAPSFTSEDLRYLDEDILVDRYDYGGHELTARLTWLFPIGVKMVIEAGQETQHYHGQTALDLDGEPNGLLEDRLDEVTFGGLTLEIPLTRRLDLGLDYQIESSRSNDAFYDYTGRQRLSVSLDVDF